MVGWVCGGLCMWLAVCGALCVACGGLCVVGCV